jgi:hypothetical protein
MQNPLDQDLLDPVRSRADRGQEVLQDFRGEIFQLHKTTKAKKRTWGKNVHTNHTMSLPAQHKRQRATIAEGGAAMQALRDTYSGLGCGSHDVHFYFRAINWRQASMHIN